MKNWSTGGIADSKRQGSQNSSYTLKNCQIHEDPGVLKCHEGLTADVSGTGPTSSDQINAIVHHKSKVTYIFGDDGDVWTRSESDVYALLGSIPAGSAYGKINDAKEFNGAIYYTMQERVGKYVPGDAWNNSTTAGTQNNFKIIDFDLYHPLIVVQNDLYVGNLNHVGKITPDETFDGLAITQALLLDSTYTVESFGRLSRYLIVGARVSGTVAGTFVGFASVFKWDLVSDTFTSQQEIKEFGISAFIEFKGSLLFNAGQDGNLYSYDGQFAREFRRIPDSFDNDTTITKNAWGSLKGITLLGVTQSGTSGVYSLGGYDAKHQDVLNLPFSMSNATVNVIAWAGADLLIAYKLGSTNHLDILTTALATAETETLIQELLSSDGRKVAVRPKVRYESYPSGSNIQLYQKDNTGSYVEIPLNKDPSDKQLNARTVYNTREVQYKLILTPNGTNSPIVEFFG